MLDALNQLTIECLEKVSSNEPTQGVMSSIGGSFDPSKQRIFGLMKMQEAINANLFRIDVFWDLVIAHFLCIANSKNSNLRKMAVDTLNNFISSAFSFFFGEIKKMNFASGQNEEEHKETKKKEGPILNQNKSANNIFLKEKWSMECWQKTLLQPWLDVIRCKFNEVKENIVNSLLRLLQDNGHEITNSGWSIILSILKEVSEESNSNYNNTGENEYYLFIL